MEFSQGHDPHRLEFIRRVPGWRDGGGGNRSPEHEGQPGILGEAFEIPVATHQKILDLVQN